MLTALVVVFVITYAAIAVEYRLKINKSASALVGAGLLWTIYALSFGNPHEVGRQLGESVTAIARIVFFLMGAMTIVEVIDAHDGFEGITKRVRTSKLSTLMWIVGFVSFFSKCDPGQFDHHHRHDFAVAKLLAKHDDRLFFAGIIIIAANSGGAWSPIGDVTTTMLWIGGQITATGIIKSALLPAVVSLLVPMWITAHALRGRDVTPPDAIDAGNGAPATEFERNLMFLLGPWNPGRSTRLQDRDRSSPIHGHPVRLGHPLAGW
jgi:Na+/H+ antiporter NhaD/arsenite permease-like protein